MPCTVRSEDPPPYNGGVSRLGLSEEALAELRAALVRIDEAPHGEGRLVALHDELERVRQAERKRIADRLVAP